MRRLAMGALCAMVLATAPLRGQSVFPLTERAIKKGDPLPVSWATRRLRMEPARALAGKKSRKSAGQVHYFKAVLAGREVKVALQFDRKPKLYVDTDGDGDFSDEQPIEGSSKTSRARSNSRSTSHRLAFGPFVLAMSNPAVRLKLSASGRVVEGGSASLTFRQATARVARVQLGKATRRVEFVDADFDGKYETVFDPDLGYSVSDGFAIDINGNGKMDRDGLACAEVMPLPGKVQIDGTYYAMVVARDGTAVRFEEVVPRFGTLEVGSADAEVKLFSDTGFHHLRRGTGKWRLPEGRYQAFEIKLVRQVKNARWVLDSDWSTGALHNFEVRHNATAAFRVGLPLTGKTVVQKRADQLSVGFTVKGQAGEEYSAGIAKNGRVRPAPKFKIVSETGKVLVSKAFEYG